MNYFFKVIHRLWKQFENTVEKRTIVRYNGCCHIQTEGILYEEERNLRGVCGSQERYYGRGAAGAYAVTHTHPRVYGY